MQAQTDFYEIYDYYSQPLMERTSVWVLLAILILSITSFVLFLFFKRKKRQVYAWDRALNELSTLNPDECLSKGEYKSFYFKLTQILKRYLDQRFNWNTENKTDEELILYLGKQNFDSELKSQVEKTLHGASWIKFANEDALKSQAEADLKTIIFVVKSTKPSENK